MIRRETHAPSGLASWLLISQPEHARIAGELAKHWVGPPADPAPIAAELLAAVYHHDDGWRHWEQQPDVDHTTGRPLNFTEMPLAVALEIWQGSIDCCVALGPLSGYVVSGHFSALLRHANHWQRATPQIGSPAAQFLARQDSLRARLLDEWVAGDPQHRSAKQAEQDKHQLQFFDAFSLWLCTAERHAPDRLDLPGSKSLDLAPLETRAPLGSQQIAIAPWPFDVECLELTASGRLVPQARYDESKALAAAPSQQVALDWRLVAR
jgi:hypothetical protein